MKYKDLNGMSKSALEQNLAESKLELMKANVQMTMGTDPKMAGKIREIKKKIARILTILNSKKNEEE